MKFIFSIVCCLFILPLHSAISLCQEPFISSQLFIFNVALLLLSNFFCYYKNPFLIQQRSSNSPFSTTKIFRTKYNYWSCFQFIHFPFIRGRGIKLVTNIAVPIYDSKRCYCLGWLILSFPLLSGEYRDTVTHARMDARTQGEVRKDAMRSLGPRTNTWALGVQLRSAHVSQNEFTMTEYFNWLIINLTNELCQNNISHTPIVHMTQHL